MDKSELKQILKPLIKECIKEVIFEEGVLSGLITEVVHGLGTPSPPPPIINPVQPPPSSQASTQARNQLNEIKQQMQKASGLVGAFEGTVPLASHKTQNSQHGPLRDQSPQDAGVNIDGLIKMTGGWNQIK